MNKRLKLFKRLGTLKKRDLAKDQFQSNLILKEINKTNDLLEKIDTIITENNNVFKSDKLSAAFFKNNSNLLSTLNNQRSIARNKKEFLSNQKKTYDLKIAQNNKDKKRVQEKFNDELKIYKEELENKNYISIKKK